jgi:exopolysaccharide production protein ExoZ
MLFLPEKDTPPVLYLGWSLNYEMFFYLIFGISLVFKRYRYFFIVVFFIITYILGLLFDFGSAYMQMVTNYSNLFFIAGILFALLLAKVTVPKKWATVISIVGITFFILHLFKIIVITNHLLVLLIVSMFVLSFLLFDFTFHIKGNRFLIFLGDISYSLYLSHPFVEILFRKFKVQGYLNLTYLVLKLAIVIAVAAFFYYFVERKITEYLKLKLKA